MYIELAPIKTEILFTSFLDDFSLSFIFISIVQA